jgi:hypothetical protein
MAERVCVGQAIGFRESIPRLRNRFRPGFGLTRDGAVFVPP